MTLVRALHGRRPWPELELQGRHHGGAHRRGERGGRRGESRAQLLGALEGRAGCSAMAPLFGLLAAVREKKGERRKEKRREEKRREEKREKRKEGKEKNEKEKRIFFPNLEISGKR
jgi:hypothetical protein